MRKTVLPSPNIRKITAMEGIISCRFFTTATLMIGSGFENIFRMSKIKARMKRPQNVRFTGEPKGNTALVVVAINRAVVEVKRQAAPNQSVEVW